MERENAIRHQSGYYQGYAEGFNEGYHKAFEHFREQLLTQRTQIIVTTQKNLEKVKKDYNI